MKRSFFPGRRFVNPADVQTQLDEWFTTIANVRVHATLKAKPAELFIADKQAMRPLPPFPPVIGVRPAVRLPRNYYITVDTNQYSVDPAFIDRLVTVRSTLDEITVTGPSGETAAVHPRSWGQYKVITDPAHAQTARAMRHHLATTVKAVQPDTSVEVADLSVYDAIA